MGFSAGEMDKMRGLSLELSSRCQLSCKYCARGYYEGYGKGTDLDLRLLDKIMPFVSRFDSMDLTGWGEPLMHPYFFKIIKDLRKEFKGRLTFTTNGLLFDGVGMELCIEEQVDAICFSLDAVDEGGYESIRGAKKFLKLLELMEEFVSRRRRANKEKPGIFATYLLRRSRLNEVFELVNMLEGIGLDGVLFQQMLGVFSEEGLKEITYSGYYPTDFRAEELNEVIMKAKKSVKGKFLIVGPEKVFSERVFGCGVFELEKPLVKANGDVSPCCVLGYPVRMLSRKKEPKEAKVLIFGNIAEKGLDEIWASGGFFSFREEMRKNGYARACGDCIGLYIKSS